MGSIVEFQLGTVDFESAVEEVDFLTTKYLEALEELSKEDDFQEIGNSLDKVISYWERLSVLFRQLSLVEQDIPFNKIMRDSLQSELITLEKVYLKINMRIEFAENQWTKEMWKVAEKVLSRMDYVLKSLDFQEDHNDRLTIGEIAIRNQTKYQQWLKRNKTC